MHGAFQVGGSTAMRHLLLLLVFRLDLHTAFCGSLSPLGFIQERWRMGTLALVMRHAHSLFGILKGRNAMVAWEGVYDGNPSS